MNYNNKSIRQLKNGILFILIISLFFLLNMPKSSQSINIFRSINMYRNKLSNIMSNEEKIQNVNSFLSVDNDDYYKKEVENFYKN